MGVDGIWKLEKLAIGGWEPAGTVFLQDGRYLRGGNHAFTVGRYELHGDQIKIEATSTRYKGGQAVYGVDAGEIEITLEGEVAGDAFTAEATDGRFVTRYRYSRITDMP